MGKILYGMRYVEDDEEELENWTKSVKATTDYNRLHHAIIEWSVILGKLALDDYPGRASIGRRMDIISEQMALTEQKENQPLSEG